MPTTDSEPPFPVWVYWLVLGVSAALGLLLWWFTARYNMPLGGG